MNISLSAFTTKLHSILLLITMQGHQRKQGVKNNMNYHVVYGNQNKKKYERVEVQMRDRYRKYLDYNNRSSGIK